MTLKKFVFTVVAEIPQSDSLSKSPQTSCSKDRVIIVIRDYTIGVREWKDPANTQIF